MGGILYIFVNYLCHTISSNTQNANSIMNAWIPVIKNRKINAVAAPAIAVENKLLSLSSIIISIAHP
jgi:hypothetical protein